MNFVNIKALQCLANFRNIIHGAFICHIIISSHSNHHNPLKLVIFKYIYNFMLISATLLIKIIRLLKNFICGFLNVCSIQPGNIFFKVGKKLCNL